MRGTLAIQRRGAIVTKLAGVLSLCLLLSGCQTVGAFEGWATLGADTLVQSVPACVIPTDSAVLCRDEANALGLAISPVKTRGTLESWTARQYEIQLRLQGPKTLAQNLRLLIPLLNSNEFGPVEVINEADRGQAIISLHASPIGLDLLGAALMSPAGVQGVLVGSDGQVFRLDARLARRDEAVGKVWLSRHRTHLLLESRVEYTTLWSVQNTASQQVAQTLLQPGKLKWVPLCDGVCADPQQLRYLVVAVPTVPQLSYWFH